MFNIILKFSKCIEELTTILGLSGFFLFLLSKHVKQSLKWIATPLFLFLIAWRLEISKFKVMSSRYVSGLIIPFLLFAVWFVFCIQRKKSRTNKCIATVLVALLLTSYINKVSKHNKYDANYYAIAEIVKNSEKKKDTKEFLVEGENFERLSYLSKTNNIKQKSSTYLPYISNFNYFYFPWIVDVDFDNSVTPQGKQKRICSFVAKKSSNKRINLIVSPPPRASLIVNPTLTIQDNRNNLLQNGSIEEIDSPEQSHRNLVNEVSDYSLYYEYDESIRTPKKSYFTVAFCADMEMALGIESESPIKGFHSVSVKFNNGNAFLLFNQAFHHNGQYLYSFLIKGKKGTLIQPYYTLCFNQEWKSVPICLFSVPDSQTYLISTEFDIDGLNETDFFKVGVKFRNGEALLDDFVLSRK